MGIARTLRRNILPQDAQPIDPTRQEMVASVMTTAHQAGIGCSPERAESVIRMLERARNAHRKGETYILSRNDMAKRHRILDAIMTDDATPLPGSTFAMLNRGLLEGNELSFRHGREGTEIVWCALYVEVDSV